MYESDVEIFKASRTDMARNECVICQQLSGVLECDKNPFLLFYI